MWNDLEGIYEEGPAARLYTQFLYVNYYNSDFNPKGMEPIEKHETQPESQRDAGISDKTAPVPRGELGVMLFLNAVFNCYVAVTTLSSIQLRGQNVRLSAPVSHFPGRDLDTATFKQADFWTPFPSPEQVPRPGVSNISAINDFSGLL